MRTLVHLPNLRIGRCPRQRLEKLESWMERLQPSLLVVSGNLTASGSHWQFAEAKAVLQRLPSPQIVVPGNSDAPRWDPIARLVSPWENFDTFFGKNRTPYFADNEIVVAGIRSAVALPFQKPTVGKMEQLFVQELMATAEPGLVKAVVSHHPVFLPDKYEPREEDGRVFRSQVDLFITGQLWTDREPRGHRESDTAVFVGTTKDACPSFQKIRISGQELAVETYVWEDDDFKVRSTQQHRLLVLSAQSA